MPSARTHDDAYRYEHNLQRLISQLRTSSDLRERAVEEFRTTLLRDRSVMLVAAAGMGKLGVAKSVARSLSPAGVIGYRCGSPQDAEALRRFKTLDATSVVIVSATHLLETPALEALRELVTSGQPRVIVTLSTGRPFAPSDAGSAERSALWVSMGLKRIELPGMGIADAYPLVTAEGEKLGVQVPLSSLVRIMDGAQGNPLLLKELTREFCASNPGVTVQDYFFTARSPSLRLIDILYPHVAGLTGDEAFALVALARLGEVPQPRAARLVGLQNVRMLSRSGLLELVGADGVVRANTTYACIIEQRHPLPEGELEERLVTELLTGQRLSSNEHFVIALHWIHSPVPPTRVTDEQAREVYARAAHQANRWGYAELTHEFAGRAFALRPTVSMATMRARGFAAQGDLAGACALLDDERLPHDSAEADCELLLWRLSLAAVVPEAASFEEVMTRARSWGTVDELLEHAADFFEYLVRDHAEVGPEDVAALEVFAGNERLPLSVRLSALAALMSAYTYLGHAAQLADTITRGRAIVGSLWFEEHAELPRSLEKVAGVFIAQAGFLEAFTGVYRDALEVKMLSLGLYAARVGDEFSLGLLDIVSGYLLYTQGRYDAALAAVEHGVLTVPSSAHQRWGTTARALLGGALALVGRVDDAETVLKSIAGAPGLLAGLEECTARMIVLERRGDIVGVKALALGAAKRDPGTSRTLAVATLYAGFRLGVPVDEILPALDSVTSVGSVPALDAAEDHMRASSAQDPHALRTVGDRFSAMRLAREASAAYREAHTLHLQRGEHAEARQCAILLGSAPAEDERAEIGPERVLTRREAEVAMLASRGLTNAEIAKRLYLSVRTVESHILQARTKTGAASKQDLAESWAEYAPR